MCWSAPCVPSAPAGSRPGPQPSCFRCAAGRESAGPAGQRRCVPWSRFGGRSRAAPPAPLARRQRRALPLRGRTAHAGPLGEDAQIKTTHMARRSVHAQPASSLSIVQLAATASMALSLRSRHTQSATSTVDAVTTLTKRAAATRKSEHEGSAVHRRGKE